MDRANPNTEEIKLDVAGSSTFGRNPKIMSSRTFNMILADNWLIDSYGYKRILSLIGNGFGRGAFSSVRANGIFVVINEVVYFISVFSASSTGNHIYATNVIGQLNTFAGAVFFSENNVNQVAICDGSELHIYNYDTGVFSQATLPDGVLPSYVAYKNGRFLLTDGASANWFVSAVGDGLNWFPGASDEPLFASIQTKADLAQAIFGFPGLGNAILLLGKTVGEIWTDVGGAIFPYQKNTSINFDYGCVNPETIAFSEDYVAWLGSNEKSGPVILVSNGGQVKNLSTDGINYKLSQLIAPENSGGFFIKLAGHLLYQLTFYDPRDNYTLVYDFTTEKFFDFTDEHMDYHTARKAVFFDNDYYFISWRDGNFYQLSAQFTTFDYGTFEDDTPKVYEIPRKRVCSNLRKQGSDRFIINQVTFIIEQGNDTENTGNNPDYYPVISLSVSQNGGMSFGDEINYPVYKVGIRENKLDWWNLGAANDLVCQFSFHGKGPWKCTNGLVYTYQ